MQPILGAILGGWEIVLILAILLGLGALVVVVVGVIFVATRASPQKCPPPPVASPAGPVQPRDLEQELRTLARLKEQGLVTEEEFNLKKKAMLGI